MESKYLDKAIKLGAASEQQYMPLSTIADAYKGLSNDIDKAVLWLLPLLYAFLDLEVEEDTALAMFEKEIGEDFPQDVVDAMRDYVSAINESDYERLVARLAENQVLARVVLAISVVDLQRHVLSAPIEDDFIQRMAWTIGYLKESEELRCWA